MQVYSVIMTEYLAGGGDGFKVISEHKERQLQGPLDTDILKVGPRWTITEKASNRASTKIIIDGQLSESMITKNCLSLICICILTYASASQFHVYLQQEKVPVGAFSVIVKSSRTFV